MDPAIPQLSSVTSESLQRTVRQLLPSQQGFGVDLAASNVIIPVIDLTPSAEGADLPLSLQQAITHGSTAFTVNNTTTTVINNTGFWRLRGTASNFAAAATTSSILFLINDGATDVIAWGSTVATDASGYIGNTNNFDLFCFLPVGHTFKILAGVSDHVIGSATQVADVNGSLQNPVGFTPQ